MNTPIISAGYKDLIVIKTLRVGPVSLDHNRVKAPYEITLRDNTIHRNELIYSYDEKVFDPGSSESINLGSMITAQVAINYGLFCEEIQFDGLFDDSDKRFINDMTGNTSREIYVNKFLFKNEFLLPPYNSLTPEKRTSYTNARISFINTAFQDYSIDWQHSDNEQDNYVILSSGGKDSLLSYGVLKELGKEVHPIFINESGRHWFTAINAHRHLKETDVNTAKVWCNSDRIFNWVLRLLPFIRNDFDKIKSDIYPIRLWTMAVFLFGVLPFSRKRKAGRIIIGDEYDSTRRLNYQGITHYDALYDQSKHFDNAMTRYYLKKGWNINQFSIIRCLSELLILKILTKRYPDLQKHQISCHASSEREGRIYPCGNCEKCRRIIGMLSALDEDPQRCGYSKDQIKNGLAALEKFPVKQLGADASHLFYLLLNKGLVSENEFTAKQAKQHDYIMRLRFDKERSNMADLPSDIRSTIITLYLKYAEESVFFKDKKWAPIDILKSELLQSPYPFEVTANPAKKMNLQPGYLWEKLTWQEIEEKLRKIDTAILPCGSIEQHGPHLPVDVDFYDVAYLARKVADGCSDPKPFVLPGIPYGVSYHHEDFKGTISVTNEALAKLVYDLGMSLSKNGIKKIIILNGHGDNSPTLQYAAQMINRDANIFVCVDTGETSDPDLYNLIDTQNDIHAGEIETSTTLALRPEEVQMEKAVNKTLEFGSSYLDFDSIRRVAWYVRTNKLSKSGIMGDPTKATAEKGKKMWEIIIAHLVKFTEEIKRASLDDLYQKRY